MANEVELKLDGKYTFRRDKQGRVTCLRYGKPWRDFTGDHAVTLLFERVATLDEVDRLAELAQRSATVSAVLFFVQKIRAAIVEARL